MERPLQRHRDHPCEHEHQQLDVDRHGPEPAADHRDVERDRDLALGQRHDDAAQRQRRALGRSDHLVRVHRPARWQLDVAERLLHRLLIV